MKTFTKVQSDKMARLLRDLWTNEKAREFWSPDLTEKIVVTTCIDNWDKNKSGAENAYEILCELIGKEIIDSYI